MLARGASLVRMCEHAGAPYEYVSARDAMAPLCSVWNGEGDTFAPPVVVDEGVYLAARGRTAVPTHAEADDQHQCRVVTTPFHVTSSTSGQAYVHM